MRRRKGSFPQRGYGLTFELTQAYFDKARKPDDVELVK
jgi:hypothetical protein